MADEPKRPDIALVPQPIDVSQLHNMMGPTLDCCGNCDAFRDDPMRKGSSTGICCAHPPVAQVIQSMGGSPLDPHGMQPQIQLQSFQPPTEKRRWCREHRKKVNERKEGN